MMKLTARHIVPFLGLTFLAGLVLLLLSTSPAVAEVASVTPLPPVEGVDGRAGACYSFYYDPPEGPTRPFIQQALDAGSRWDRFDFIWPNIETSNDAWNFESYDTLVDDLHAAEMKNLVGILLWTPNWASTVSASGGLGATSFDQRPLGWYAPTPRTASMLQAASAASSPPRGLYLSWDDPNNYWGNYVYTVVSRYKDRVKYWEMWNEPEWDYFWTGTSAEYAQLLKIGYQATKAACPDCTVLFGGLHYWANTSYYRWVLGALNDDPAAPSNNYFFDVMSVHLYSRSSSVYDEVNNIRSGMTTYNVGDHPIWLTETGVPVWGDLPEGNPKPKYDYAATQDEAAAYVIQSYANSWASDVERYFFFRTHDSDMSEYFGLIRNDHTLRPAYVAYQVAATYLISPTFVTRESVDSHLNVTLWGAPRGKVSVLWNESPATGVYTLPAAIDTATLVDRLGVTSTITATGGAYTFTLPGATANRPVPNEDDYIIGGDPLILIESETPNEPPTSTVHSLPATIYSPTFTITWEGHDNESGVWLYDVQARDGTGGEWSDLEQSTSVTSTQFTGQHAHIYYFRSRATDHVGNRADWPVDSQAHTTLDLASTLHFSVGAFFADENRDGAWNKPITETGEITMTQVTVRLLDETGDVITPTLGSTSEFTTTIYAGQSYRLLAASTERSTAEREIYHEGLLSFTWPRGNEIYTETYTVLALLPVERVYLPLVMRNG